MAMKYSIIIPIFHSEKTIERCLDSFLNQTVSDSFEILCVGDKVDDPSHEIIMKYAQKYPGVVQLHLQDGRGVGGARNFGLDLAEGDYIMFSDADDYVSPEMLEKCTSALIEHNADFVCAGFERISESGKKYSSEMSGSEVSVIELVPENVPRLAFIYTAPWGKLFKRELIGESRFTDDPISAYEDLMFHMYIYPKAQRYVLLHETLYYYIVYPQSSISTVSQKRTQTFRNDLTAMKQHYISSGFPEPYHKMLDIVAIIHVAIADVHRTAEDSSINLRVFCKEVKKYLDENFPGWRKVKFRPYGHFSTRCAAVWGSKQMHRVNMFWLFIRFYNWMIRALHIDVKW